MLTRRAFAMHAAGLAAASLLPSAGAAGWPKQQAAARDANLLVRIYQTLHPGLMRYHTRDSWQAAVESFVEAMFASRDRAGAYLALARFTATIRCGHTYANFFNQSDEVAGELFAGQTRMPLDFDWIGREAVVTRSLPGGEPAKRGDTILALNGTPMADVLGALMPFVRADGGNDAKRIALLGPAGRDGIETFDVFQSLIFPPREGGFGLELRAPDGAKRRVRLPAIDLAARKAALKPGAETGPEEPMWTFTMTGRTGVLTMPNWAVYKSKWDWEGFLDRVFESLRGAKGLIVDLRGNEGGNDCGDAIIARLIDRDIKRDRARRLVRAAKVPADLNPYLDTWDDGFRDWGDAAKPAGEGWFELVRGDETDGAITPKGPRFRGKVVVLIDAANSSATFQFASAIRKNGLGTLLGGPTGGNRRGINGGAFFFVRLPETGLEADLPLIGYYPDASEPDEGLLPDIAVMRAAADLASGRDAVMERALAEAA